MNADLAILAGAGSEWNKRVKRLASTAPGLDIFTEGFVVRDASGWQITEAGRKILRQMDSMSRDARASFPVPPIVVKPVIVARCAVASASAPPAKVIGIAAGRRLPRRAV